MLTEILKNSRKQLLEILKKSQVLSLRELYKPEMSSRSDNKKFFRFEDVFS